MRSLLTGASRKGHSKDGVQRILTTIPFSEWIWKQALYSPPWRHRVFLSETTQPWDTNSITAATEKSGLNTKMERWYILLWKNNGNWTPEGYSTKFYTERLRPDVQPFTLLCTIFDRKVPLSYTFYWHTRIEQCIPGSTAVNELSFFKKWYEYNKSLN